MTTRNEKWLVGLLFLLLCGPALAHDGYSDSGWSGSVTVWGDSHGRADWSGALNYGYGVAYGYAPGYIPWAANHRHGPQCRHGAGHGYGKAYREGYRHGRSHSRKHSHKHGYHH